MKIKLAVPDNPLFEPMYGNKHLHKELSLITVPENDVHALLFSHEVDAALITPLGYSKGLKKHDLRIIPNSAMTAIGYTGIGSMFFKAGLDDIRTIGSNAPNDFLMVIASILIKEKYGIDKKTVHSRKEIQEIISEFDMSFLWIKSSLNQQALDITEEWYDSYEIPLPLAFWSCRFEEYPVDILSVVQSISSVVKEEDRIYEFSDNDNKYFPREGKILWKWNDDVESSLEQVLHLLYFHQLANEIAAVKILGRD